MRYTSLILFILFSFSINAQTIIQGKVTDSSKNAPAENVNVTIREKGNPAISSFALTDKGGKYKLEYKGKQDSIIVTVGGFNVKKEERIIPNKTQELNFRIVFESVSLKEVKITPPKIRQTGDTVNYLVDGFVDQNDRTIGDVLKKMPGIDVKESGEVLYQNKPINKFYIEGMDLLQGRYGVATNNIKAEDVRTVQIMENHQPIKALKDRILSEQAALNLKLKDSAKGTLTGNALLGVGAEPLLWTAELALMYFAQGKQNITTYKGNNIGQDISRELNSFYSSGAQEISKNQMLSIQSPSSPSINQKRYLFNNMHGVTFNNLWKVKDYQINANINYLNNREDKSSSATTEYYLPGNEILKIEEKMNSRTYTNQANADIQINSNRDKYYFNNLFKFNGNWNNDRGDVFSSQNINQKLNKPNYGVSNNFDLVKNYEKTSINLSSFNGYLLSPHKLTIQPMLYPDLFDPEQSATGIIQEVEQERFLSYTKISGGYDKRRLKQNYALSFRADLHHLNSDLMPQLNALKPFEQIDSLSNNLQFNKFEWVFSPSYTYSNEDFRASLSLPINYTLFHVNNKIEQNKKDFSRFFLNPSLFLMYKLTVFWNINAHASYNNGFGGLNNEYSGYIMRSYRNLGRNSGNFFESNTQNYSMTLNYRNPLRSLFGNFSVNYSDQKANLLYGSEFSDFLQIQTPLNEPNHIKMLSLTAGGSKTIDEISSTVRLDGRYSLNSASTSSQGKIVNFEGANYSLTPSFTTKIQRWASASYSFTFSESKSRIKNSAEEMTPIRTTSQNAKLNIFPTKNLTVNLTYEYFYNNALTSGNRTMSFGDIALKYKWKKMEFMLDYTNVFNSKQYMSAYYNDINSYCYLYDLRPSEIVFRMRFNLK